MPSGLAKLVCRVEGARCEFDAIAKNVTAVPRRTGAADIVDSFGPIRPRACKSTKGFAESGSE